MDEHGARGGWIFFRIYVFVSLSEYFCGGFSLVLEKYFMDKKSILSGWGGGLPRKVAAALVALHRLVPCMERRRKLTGRR
jgi:hypothetical protein